MREIIFSFMVLDGAQHSPLKPRVQADDSYPVIRQSPQTPHTNILAAKDCNLYATARFLLIHGRETRIAGARDMRGADAGNVALPYHNPSVSVCRCMQHSRFVHVIMTSLGVATCTCIATISVTASFFVKNEKDTTLTFLLHALLFLAEVHHESSSSQIHHGHDNRRPSCGLRRQL